MITVEDTESDFLLKIPKVNVSRQQVDAWINWIELDAIASKSKMSDEQIDELANQIKKEWWAANKDRFIPPHLQ